MDSYDNDWILFVIEFWEEFFDVGTLQSESDPARCW